jgi:hypothetical protein
MGNFIENTFSGIGNAVSGLFGGSRGSGSSRGVGQQVAEAARQKAMEDRYDTPPDENAEGFGLVAQLAKANPEFLRDRRSIPGTSGGVPMKKGGKVKAYANGGSVSARADGCAQRGKTKGRIV